MRVRRILGAALVTGFASTAAVGLTATSASALNTENYTSLKNANTNQYCLDIRTEDNAEGARAQMMNCKHPVPDAQQFILVRADRHDGNGPVPGQDTIRPKGSRGSGKCLWDSGVSGGLVTQKTCFDYAQAQSWNLRSTGEIVNIFSGRCLDGANVQGGDVVTLPCNGAISQRWFF